MIIQLLIYGYINHINVRLEGLQIFKFTGIAKLLSKVGALIPNFFYV